MYGTYWCTHCHAQKQMFGERAWSLIEYVECGPNGFQSQYEDCFGHGVRGFPCWEVHGKKYYGEMTLERLAEVAAVSIPPR
mmetsp:Transcript_18032/g.37387  ORF Transcript_18032/g.37387 Transcript_18032/m.37387 type:complete len:81 (-) Transcript_18032:738-980(-)